MTRATNSNVKVARGAISSWVVIATQDTPLATVLSPDYWLNVEPRFKRLDEITVLHDGNEYETRIRVTAAHPNFAFREIPGCRWEAQIKPLPAATEDAAGDLGLRISHGGKSQGWRVLRGSDVAHQNGKPLVNLGSKQAAENKLRELTEAAG